MKHRLLHFRPLDATQRKRAETDPEAAVYLWLCATASRLPTGQVTYKLPRLDQISAHQSEAVNTVSKMVFIETDPGAAYFPTVDMDLPPLKGPKFNPIIASLQLAPAEADMGSFSGLPVEILEGILGHLDIHSLDCFKTASRSTYTAVTEHPMYRVINHQAHDALRCYRVLDENRDVTLKLLYEVLCASVCARCGAFGGYLYLRSCARVCSACYLSMDKSNHHHHHQQMEQCINQVPGIETAKIRVSSLKRVPQLYQALTETKGRRQVNLAAAKRAHERLRTSNFTFDIDKLTLEDLASIDYLDDESLDEVLSESTSSLQNVLDTAADTDVVEINMATVRVPYLNRQTGLAEWGFSCAGCQGMYPWSGDPRREYIMSSFREHLRKLSATEQTGHGIDWGVFGSLGNVAREIGPGEDEKCRRRVRCLMEIFGTGVVLS